MSKITIIEPNTNDKDTVRNYMVKGERGYSAYELYVQNGGTLTEEEWLDSFLNADNYYSKSETDDLLDNKANASNVYTKTETDNLLNEKADTTDLSNYKLIGDFAIITGSLSDGEDTASYPDGYTSDNCVLIAVQLQHPAGTQGWTYGTNFDSSSLLVGGLPTKVNMRSDGIVIKTYNIGISDNSYPSKSDVSVAFNYKIVLMKIN